MQTVIVKQVKGAVVAVVMAMVKLYVPSAATVIDQCTHVAAVRAVTARHERSVTRMMMVPVMIMGRLQERP